MASLTTLSFLICTELNKQNDILNVHVKCRGLADAHPNLGIRNPGAVFSDWSCIGLKVLIFMSSLPCRGKRFSCIWGKREEWVRRICVSVTELEVNGHKYVAVLFWPFK